MPLSVKVKAWLLEANVGGSLLAQIEIEKDFVGNDGDVAICAERVQASISAGLQKWPVGLLGCTTIMARVRGVMACSTACMSICQPWS